ncbi:MAG: four helix bundle protein, partial [Flavobacteriales bacterium]|nr:four helix bundle protein [Flavobacteriales bacterium]
MTKGLELCDRLFQFSIDVIKFLRRIKTTSELSVLKYQLTKSATSSGANYEESQAAASRADFKYKVGISLREMRESNYW